MNLDVTKFLIMCRKEKHGNVILMLWFMWKVTYIFWVQIQIILH